MKMISALVLGILSANSWAVKLSEYKPFQYEALFTNPICANYKYERPVQTESGKTVTQKPKNVYCKASDENTSVSRNVAPQYRLVEWISDVNTKELNLAYLSFSSKNITTALCSAIKRGVKVTMVLDSGENPATPTLNKDAEGLKKCGAKNLVSVTYRGSTRGLGYAHNKIMLVNPGAEVSKVVFSSGNMTGGTSINHENWNFVTTSGSSYFAQVHKCAIDAMITGGESKASFGRDLNNCRSKISALPESDIQVFFSPIDGEKALTKVTEAAYRSRQIEAMSHRFSGRLAELFKGLLNMKKPIKFILDDDIYWSAKRHEDIGRNTRLEAYKIYKELINAGMETKFLQTNQSIFQLQHNKFMIFTFDYGGAVFNGAGNFTSAAFTKNFENFYFITIPSVVETYNRQYDAYFDMMATSSGDMPRDYVLP